MLSLHHIKHAEVQFQMVDLSIIVQEIITNLQAKEPEHCVEVAIADSVMAQGDPLLLRIALENLLSNAWKYSAKVAHPRIEFGSLENSATFYVKDNGAGFNMKDVDQLFQPFKRLHHRREFEGNGIGLASVARIVERHSGKIWAKAELNQGATFFFSLATA